MVRGIGGFGVFQNFHCEKIQFLTFGALLATLYFVLQSFVGNFPSIEILGYNITGLWLAVLVLIGGYGGVVFYRITNNKRPIFVWKFWSTND